MHRASYLALSTAAVLLELLPLVAAHGTDHDGSAGMSDMDMNAETPPSDTPAAPVPDRDLSYWVLTDHVTLLYSHILIMVIAWVVIGPIAVMLSIAKSRLTLLAQFLFLSVNAVGLVLGVIYDRNTPDLYENNSHGKIGWALTWIVSAWTFMRLIQAYVARSTKNPYGSATHPMSVSALAQYQRVHQSSSSPVGRWSRDSGQGTERNSESLFGHSRSPSDQSETQRFQLPEQRYDHEDDEDDYSEDVEKRGFLQNTAVDRFLSRNLSKLAPLGRTMKVIDFLYILIERFIPILGFSAILTGSIVLAGIAKGNNVFNVLAHFIKGGIFFWYGLLTLGRWMGSFADFGWAWNVKPSKELVGPTKARIPTAEFTESFVIFLYGASNVFLEHLAAWGGAWSAQDLEHVSISVMFFGGGLLGMLIESKRVRELINTFILSTNPEDSGDETFTTPKSYNVSLNPLPGLIIMLLGIMMSSHHQDSMLSTMVHKQWGTMFVGFALARGVTYILLFLSPPTSYLPSRPPSELITSFCLTAGGITFILSSRDIVQSLEQYNLDAMFTFTVTMGLTCLLLAWVMFLVAFKGWASRRERPQQKPAFLTAQMQMPA